MYICIRREPHPPKYLPYLQTQSPSPCMSMYVSTFYSFCKPPNLSLLFTISLSLFWISNPLFIFPTHPSPVHPIPLTSTLNPTHLQTLVVVWVQNLARVRTNTDRSAGISNPTTLSPVSDTSCGGAGAGTGAGACGSRNECA